MGLAKETKARGWWHAYGDVIPEGFDVYIGLEEAASQLAWYESELVPGLLQTEDYARTLIAADNPGVDDEEISRRVHVRMARQPLIRRATAPLHLQVALNEGILRRPVGGPRIMSGQLARLAEVSELPNVSLRVVPFSAGLHPGLMSGPFVILRFPLNGDGRESEPATVYVDGFTGALYLDKPGEVERYAQAFGGIWDACLDEAASRDLIHHAAEELGNEQHRTFRRAVAQEQLQQRAGQLRRDSPPSGRTAVRGRPRQQSASRLGPDLPAFGMAAVHHQREGRAQSVVGHSGSFKKATVRPAPAKPISQSPAVPCACRML